MQARCNIEKHLTEMDEKQNLISDLKIERAVLDEKDGDFKMQERSLMEKEQTMTVVNQLRHVLEVS